MNRMIFAMHNRLEVTVALAKMNTDKSNLGMKK